MKKWKKRAGRRAVHVVDTTSEFQRRMQRMTFTIHRSLGMKQRAIHKPATTFSAAKACIEAFGELMEYHDIRWRVENEMYEWFAAKERIAGDLNAMLGIVPIVRPSTLPLLLASGFIIPPKESPHAEA
jgi:hypothetical protein